MKIANLYESPEKSLIGQYVEEKNIATLVDENTPKKTWTSRV